MACVHVSKSLQAAGVPFDDNLYHMTWFFTRDEVRRELEDAAEAGSTMIRARPRPSTGTCWLLHAVECHE